MSTLSRQPLGKSNLWGRGVVREAPRNEALRRRGRRHTRLLHLKHVEQAEGNGRGRYMMKNLGWPLIAWTGLFNMYVVDNNG